jgi:hypothetical protein
MGPYAVVLGVDYNLLYVDSKTFTMGNRMPESTLTLCQSRLYPPVWDLEFDLWCCIMDLQSLLPSLSPPSPPPPRIRGKSASSLLAAYLFPFLAITCTLYCTVHGKLENMCACGLHRCYFCSFFAQKFSRKVCN